MVIIQGDKAIVKLLGVGDIKLPICGIGNNKGIIAFDAMGKTRLINECANALYSLTKKVPDVIVCAEAKAIPFAQVLASKYGCDYLVLRKKKKAYMEEPRRLVVKSITTDGEQELWYDYIDAMDIMGKNVILFDDVVSTGSTMKALEKFAKDYQLTVLQKLTVLREGKASLRSDIGALGDIPILKKENGVWVKF